MTPAKILLLAALLLAACVRAPAEDSGNALDPAPAPLTPFFAFLASAAAAETGILQDPHSGVSVQIVAGRAYRAASGRLCRRFRVTPPQTYEGLAEGLACRDEQGRWTLSELLINPDDLDAPRLGYP